MIEQLFGSKTRVKLLNLFYGNPNRSFYVREITRKIDEQINSVRRELANLLSIGIIVSETNNNRLYYEVNQKYNYYDPLLAIFGGEKYVPDDDSVTIADVKKTTKTSINSLDNDKMKALGHIELVIYTGQFTRDESSGIDLLVVGEVNQNALQKYVKELESQEGKEIRYVLMPLTEFEYRRQIKDRFITNTLDSKKQVLVDNIGIIIE